jgi:hypothetical protein
MNRCGANAGTKSDEDMEIEDDGPPGALPPPPPPPPPDAEVGPARPPANADLSSAYADPAAYEAYVQASVAYQVLSTHLTSHPLCEKLLGSAFSVFFVSCPPTIWRSMASACLSPHL